MCRLLLLLLPFMDATLPFGLKMMEVVVADASNSLFGFENPLVMSAGKMTPESLLPVVVVLSSSNP